MNLFTSQVGSSSRHISEPTEVDDEEYETDMSEGFTDSDFDMSSDESDEREDNELFSRHVDEGVEWAGGWSEVGNEGVSEEYEGDDAEEGDIVSNSSDFDSRKGSDEEDAPNYPVFSHVDLRVYAKCGEEGCDWRIHALAIGKGQSTFQIKDYRSVHNCATNYHIKNLKSSWVGTKYQHLFITDPKRRVKGFREDVVKEIRVHVSRQQAYRAKWVALKKIEGDSMEQYGKLWDYVEELRRSNPGSTVILSVLPDVGSGSSVFDKFYCCFKGLRDGFLAGCRLIIGVDGAHLKGPHCGVLLSAVGIDPNNGLYPICYAVVARETKATWEWFLSLLKSDLNIEAEFEYTFMSDKQKGLLPAFEKVFANSVNRFCIRHLHGNMKTAGFRGQAHKKALWKVAMATTVAQFDVRYKELCKLDLKLGEWLIDKTPSEWSRSHFTVYPKCDILLNNYCESFNSKILDAREKQIYTMLEMIRVYLMSRMQQNRDRASRNWSGQKICPRIKKILKKNMEKAASDCNPIKSTDTHYEISCYDMTKCTVDLQKHSCSCRKWDLSGIPCKHAMSAICSQKLNGQDFVDEYYSVNTYLKAYEPCIYPVNGPDKWHRTNFRAPLPPNVGRRIGRPLTARRMEVGEQSNKGRRGHSNQFRMKRSNYKVRCKFCGEKGHNKKGCNARKAAEENGQVAAEAESANFEDEQDGLFQQDEAELEAALQSVEREASFQRETEDIRDHGAAVDLGYDPQVSIDDDLEVDFSSQPTQMSHKLTARKRTKKTPDVAVQSSQKRGKKQLIAPEESLEEQFSAWKKNKVASSNEDSSKTQFTAMQKGKTTKQTDKDGSSTVRKCCQLAKKGPTFKAPRQTKSQAASQQPPMPPLVPPLVPSRETRAQAAFKPPPIPSRETRAQAAFKASGLTKATKVLTKATMQECHPGLEAKMPSRPSTTKMPSRSPAKMPSRPPSSITKTASNSTRATSASTTSPALESPSKGVKIRHVPFSPEHPRVVVSLTTRKKEPLGVKTIDKDGKKFVTMTQLNSALRERTARLLGDKKV
ncbi:hypothetical protein BUALT_Bualt02G0021000 [Buddleja alternifolia]|uniref:SWIM-type domain-containing protein n=1 Tax=Buddleja alternifolia TaxID=168488 RepID=A0AAV6XXC8_9LAMI|nr:hypothetical protein BUALT_Bualt02G0021000 [Buddleja alternifolia]